MIYEMFEDKKLITTTANLLVTFIFANSLNFKTSITTERFVKFMKN